MTYIDTDTDERPAAVALSPAQVRVLDYTNRGERGYSIDRRTVIALINKGLIYTDERGVAHVTWAGRVSLKAAQA